MLKISPGETITFQKTGNELLATVDIINMVKYPITYKVNVYSKQQKASIDTEFVNKNYNSFHFLVLSADQNDVTGKVSCSTEYGCFDARQQCQHKCRPYARTQYGIVAKQRQIFGDVHGIG